MTFDNSVILIDMKKIMEHYRKIGQKPIIRGWDRRFYVWKNFLKNMVFVDHAHGKYFFF